MEKIIEKLKKSRRAAVMAHISEDPDALGSCFAMCCALKAMGNEPVCYVSEEIDEGLRFIGNDYVVYDPEKGCDIEHDLCVSLDCGDKKRLGERAAIFDKCPDSVNIDHHFTNEKFANENYVEPDTSATGEILYKLFRKMNIEITKEIAEYLYIAIAADTGCFKFSSVTPTTMRIIADLLETGIDHAETARLLFDTETIENMKFKGELMGNIHTYADGKLNVVCIDEKLYEKYNIEDGLGSIVNIPRRVKGTEIAVCIKYKKGKMKASFRSNGRANVAAIAEQFGGGGHIMASGAVLDTDDINEAEKMICEACIEALNNL